MTWHDILIIFLVPPPSANWHLEYSNTITYNGDPSVEGEKDVKKRSNRIGQILSGFSISAEPQCPTLWTQCSCCCSYTSFYALLSSGPSLSSTNISLMMGLTLNFPHTYWYNANISRSSGAFETRLLWAGSLSRPFHKVHAEHMSAGTNLYRQQMIFVRKYNKRLQ